MIPAVLSCLFVLYLYRSLNTSEPDQSQQQPASESDLTKRLGELQKRVDRVAEQTKSGKRS